MAISQETRDQLAVRSAVLFPHPDERQRRLLMGTEARIPGHGGIRAVAQAAGVSETTVRKGVEELEAGAEPSGRVRRPGGGRKRAAVADPGLRPALLALAGPDMRGDPMSPLRWTTKPARKLAGELTRQGHRVPADTAGDLLREEGFSLQANAKTLEGTRHPGRDAQFRYINEQARDHRDAGDPVISADTKKKELAGEYENAGREWQPQGEPVKVKTHDFPGRRGPGKAIPYGICDTTANTGWVNVGCDHDTAAFAVASIRRWWHARGRHDYPHAARPLITADAGGSNSYRTRAWKTELAALAAETGLQITVCHMPPGTSKWNQVEHRLFSRISMNWRGRPLTSHDVIVNTIAATTARTGLRVGAEPGTSTCDTGIKATGAGIDALAMSRHRFHGDWNYTLHPAGVPPAPGPGTDPATVAATARPAAGPARLDGSTLRDPGLTGLTVPEMDTVLDDLIPALAGQRGRLRHERRGGERRRARGAGARDKLSDADRILATVLCLRKLGTHSLLAQLFGVTGGTLTRAIREVRPLLARSGPAIPPSTARFRTPADVAAHLGRHGNQPPRKIKPAC